MWCDSERAPPPERTSERTPYTPAPFQLLYNHTAVLLILDVLHPAVFRLSLRVHRATLKLRCNNHTIPFKKKKKTPTT